MRGKTVIAAGALALLALSATAEARGWLPMRTVARAAVRAASRAQPETALPPRAPRVLGGRAAATALVSALLALSGCGESSDRRGALAAWFIDLIGIPGVQVGPAAIRAELPPTSAPATAEIGAEAVPPPVGRRGARHRL